MVLGPAMPAAAVHADLSYSNAPAATQCAPQRYRYLSLYCMYVMLAAADLYVHVKHQQRRKYVPCPDKHCKTTLAALWRPVFDVVSRGPVAKPCLVAVADTLAAT
jgi:hypothetical protein